MAVELWFDVYGRFLVRLRSGGGDGWWLAHRHRPDGRLQAIDDLVMPREATEVEIVHAIEATYHELAAPGTDIKRVDPPRA